MKKKIAPALVVLALIAVGIGGYFLGRQSNLPAVETPPAESSTPEATPTTPVAEMTSMEFSGEYIHIVCAERLEVYESPFDIFEPVGTIPKFTYIQPAQESADGVWCRVFYDGRYLYYKFADLTEGMDDDKFYEEFMDRGATGDPIRVEGMHEDAVPQQPEEVETPKVEEPKAEEPKGDPQPQPQPTPQPKPEPKPETPSNNQGNSGRDIIPDYLQGLITDHGTIIPGSGIEGGHVGNGPGDGISWNN